MTQCWKALHYQYDDLVPLSGLQEGSEQYYQELRTRINTLYPDTSSILKEVLSYQDQFNDYIINVVYDRYALDGLAYSILFFISKPPKALSSYRQSRNFIGEIYTFSSPINSRRRRLPKFLLRSRFSKAFPPQPPTRPGEVPTWRRSAPKF